MSDSKVDKWAANFDDLTEEQQRIIGAFMYKHATPGKAATRKAPGKAATPVVNCQGIHMQCRLIARRLEALQGMASVYELYPDNIQRQALQQMAAMLHSEVRELVAVTMQLELPKTEEVSK